MRKKDHYKICCFIFLGGAKYHRKDENWLVDELRARRRPVENPNQQLSEGQRHIEWQEEVPKESVMLFDFQLTSSGKLRRQVTVRELKRVYGLQQDEDSS